MSCNIIVVDDDHSILELMQLLLENEDYSVKTFSSPVEAFEAAIDSPPDAFVVDLMMPEMNGGDLVEALRRHPRTRDIPAIVFSAYYGDLRRVIRSLGEENTVFVRKPFQIEEILNTLGRLVSRRPARVSYGGRIEEIHRKDRKIAAGF